MKSLEKLEKAELYILVASIAIGGTVSVLDLAGFLDNVVWLKERVSTITLLLAALIAGSLLAGTYLTRQFMKSAIPTGTFTHLERHEELPYLLKRIQEAKKSVYDLTWAEPLESTVLASKEDREKYVRIIQEVSKTRLYREIMMFCRSAERISKAEQLISSAGSGYQLAVFADLPKDSPLRWQFVLIDDEEVILHNLAVRQPDVVGYFRRYYESQWAAAIPVKIGDAINHTPLNEAIRRLGNKEQEAQKALGKE